MSKFLRQAISQAAMSTAGILRREFESTAEAIVYAERIARSAENNGNGIMAAEYRQAAAQLRGEAS